MYLNLTLLHVNLIQSQKVKKKTKKWFLQFEFVQKQG